MLLSPTQDRGKKEGHEKSLYDDGECLSLSSSLVNPRLELCNFYVVSYILTFKRFTASLLEPHVQPIVRATDTRESIPHNRSPSVQRLSLLKTPRYHNLVIQRHGPHLEGVIVPSRPLGMGGEVFLRRLR